MSDTNLTLTIASRESILFNGSVLSVTSVNDTGRFDILSSHENFITLIKKMVEVVLPDGSKKTFELDGGLLRVHANTITILVGLAM